MKFLYDFLPIVIFFIIFKWLGIYAATLSAIIISALQVLFHWLRYKKIEKMQLTTLLILIVLGGATLVFHNPLFIQWKVSIINWIFGSVFLLSGFIGKKNIIERFLGEKITLSAKVWSRLNLLWAFYFLIVGFVNLYVMYHYTLDEWVNFKLFGVLTITIIFIVLQTLYLVRHVKQPE